MIRKKKLNRPSELLNIYSQDLAEKLEERLISITFHINFAYQSTKVATISGYIIFRNSWILEFNEIIQQQRTTARKVKYRYHVMNKQRELIFRYDNVPHFPKIKTQPHHKHIKDTVTISKAPNLLEVIDEVEALIIKEKI